MHARADRCEWIAQLVREQRDEAVLQPVRLLGLALARLGGHPALALACLRLVRSRGSAERALKLVELARAQPAQARGLVGACRVRESDDRGAQAAGDEQREHYAEQQADAGERAADDPVGMHLALDLAALGADVDPPAGERRTRIGEMQLQAFERFTDADARLLFLHALVGAHALADVRLRALPAADDEPLAVDEIGR